MHDKKQHRFTLIEMLIILVIFLVLGVFGILFALRSARENARKISCVGNMKNISLALRMYSEVYADEFPDKNGRMGLQMLVQADFLENTHVYTCPSTTDRVYHTGDVSLNASYSYAGGLNEATSVDSATVSDRHDNHSEYGNIMFVDGHVKGFTGITWSSNRGGSALTDF